MLEARFYDGQSAKAHSVTAELKGGGQQVQILVYSEGQLLFTRDLAQAKLDDHFKGAGRKIHFGEDAVLEVLNSQALTDELKAIGYQETIARKVQTSWRWAIAALVAAIGLAALAYVYGIPWAAKVTVAVMPTKIDKYIGEQAWVSVEKELFTETKLPNERQEQLRANFAQVAKSVPNAPDYQVLFRASKVGPNAIALPDGKIVFTDELVKLAEDDRALQGVFAHELGHVKNRHSMRNILQVTAVTAMVSLWFGDLTNLIVAVPTALASLKYTRDIETEADDFAVTTMSAANISTDPMAKLFAKLPKDIKGLPSSHPVTEERIKKFSKPDSSSPPAPAAKP
jgi:Zn-dependent protease with chaperone function